MTNTTALVIPDTFDADIARLLGQNVRDEAGFPRLRINRDYVIEVDGEDKSVPPGTFAIFHEGKHAFAKAIRFRPFLQRFIWRKYGKNADGKNAYLANTIFVPSLVGVEPFDDTGGVACGKIRGKAGRDPNQLSPEQREIQKQVKAYRFLWGTATLVDPVDVDGNKVTVTDVPVELRMSGKNFLLFSDVDDRIGASRRLLPTVELSAKLKREKNGDNTYYTIDWTYDPTIVHPFRPEDRTTLDGFLAYVNRWNEGVMEKHYRARGFSPSGGAAQVSETEAASILGDDFPEPGEDDEMPF